MASLKQKTISAFKWDFTGSLVQQGVAFIISIFLARLLEPAEFGLVGMALVFISITRVFTDMGFASALIQNKNNTSLTYSSIFYLNVGMGTLLFILFQIIAPYIGVFFENETVTSLVRWLSLSFFINSFNVVQQTILRRKLQFKKLVARNLGAQAAGGIIGIIMAFNGFGVYALVAQTLAASLFTTIILWEVSDWKPKLEFSLDEVRKLTGFSTYIFLNQVFGEISRRVDVLAIGKIFSAATLGFYTRADSLIRLVSRNSANSFTNIFFPVLSKFQDDKKKFTDTYLNVLSMISFVSFGLTGVLFILGKDIITLIFGIKWLPAVPIFQILILKTFADPVNALMINAFLGAGKSKENFNVGILKKIIRMVPVLFAIYFNLEMFAWAVVSAAYMNTLINIFFMKKILDISYWKHMQKIFDGILFLLPLIIVDSIVNLSTALNIIFTLVFVIAYLGINNLRNNEGFNYIKKEGLALIHGR